MENGFLNSCSSSSSSGSSSLMVPPVSPKSPPSGSLDLYGKRRQLVKVQILEREIALIQEELKAVEGLQPASKCCKELHDFVDGRQDPLILSSLKEEPPTHKHCLSWNKLCRSWICCLSECQCRVKVPKCPRCFAWCARSSASQRRSGSESNNSNCWGCSGCCWRKPKCKVRLCCCTSCSHSCYKTCCCLCD